ncbi:MAG: DMT family transporter [Chloroflexota bacterium]
MSHRPVGVLAALGAVLIWGLTFVPGKVALAEMGPFTLAVLRFSIALAILLVAALRAHHDPGRLRKLSWGTLALLGLTGVTLYFGLQNLGLARTSASEAGLVSGSVPALTALLSALVLKERLTGLRLLGITASIGGVAAVVLAGGGPGSGGSVDGDLLVLGGAVAWAVYTLLNKRVGGQMPETLLLFYTMALGTLFMLPMAAAEIALAGFGPVSPAGWLSALFLGVGGSAAAFFCWNAALRRLDASEAATYINLVPVVTVLSAALMLGETLAPSQLLGGALVILGVYLASR